MFTFDVLGVLGVLGEELALVIDRVMVLSLVFVLMILLLALPIVHLYLCVLLRA